MIFVRSLGTAMIEAGRTQVTPASVRKFALLLYLSAESGRRVSRAALRELIFPDQREANALHSLRELVYQLRQRDFAVESDNRGLLIARHHVILDFAELAASETIDLDRLDSVEGGFLPGYAPEHSEAFSEWFDGLRARIIADLCKALATDATKARGVGDWMRAERVARACLSLEPLNEGATLALAESLAVSGSKMHAVSLLDTYMNEVGQKSAALKISASILKRRIGEKCPDQYRNSSAPPFVGRDAEMMQLRERLAVARTQASQCVVIVGEPGVGKSRLAAEFALVSALDGAHVERGSVQPHHRRRPMGAFIDLVSSLLNARGALGCSPASMHALKQLTTSGAVSNGVSCDPVDSEIREYQIAEAISDLIDAITAEAPLILLVEDAHWLDRASLRSIGDVVSARGRKGLLVLLTTREGSVTQAFPSHADHTANLTIRTLESGAASQLLSLLIHKGGLPIDAEMRRWIRVTAAGNPLFLESLLRHYACSGERFTVSPTLKALLDRRVDGISRQALTILQLCVLLGKHSQLPILEKAIQLPRIELFSAIADLEKAQMIQDIDGRLAPTHPLIAEAAENRLTSIERRLAHQCIADVLEAMASADESAALAWECAEHWLVAEDSSRAVAAVRRCARHAMEIGRPGAAAEMLLRVGTLQLHPAERAAIGREAVLAADAASEPEAVFRALSLLGMDLSRRVHDDIEVAQFRAMIRSRRDAGTLEHDLIRCVAADDATLDHRVEAATAMVKYCHSRGKRALAERVIRVLPDEVLSRASEPARLEHLMVRHSALGDLNNAVRAASGLLSVLPTVSPSTRLGLQLNISIAYWRAGLVHEAIEAAMRAHEDARQAGARRLRLKSALQVSGFLFDAERLEEARQWLDSATTFAKEVPGLVHDFILAVLTLEALVEDGDALSARALLEGMTLQNTFEGEVERRWYSALSARIRLLEGNLLADEEIQLLLTERSDVTPMTGIRDLEIVTACYALAKRGSPQSAVAILRHYGLFERQEALPMTHALRRAKQFLGLEEFAAMHRSPKPRAHGDSLVDAESRPNVSELE